MVGQVVKKAALGLMVMISVFGAAPAFARDVPVAVAANFTEPAKEIAATFKTATGDTAVLSFGASGQFYTQISHGAPFEIFLSADADRPKKAETDGFAVSGTRFAYAVGKLVLYSKTPGLVDGAGAVLDSDRFRRLSMKIAIADPTAAPYGVAAAETLQHMHLYDALKPQIVQGASITQAYQFVATGAADVGFVALSQVINEPGGSRWLVPSDDYAPIEQDAVLLKTGEADPAARAFLAFLKGPQARAIIKRYGYEVR